MCEFCGNKTPEERRRLIEYAGRVARDLEALATRYRSMAAGRIDPHVVDIRGGGVRSATALQVIKRLVEDWL